MKRFRSLESKVVRTLLLVTAIIGVAAVAIVILTSSRASSEHLTRIQRYLEQGITSKGKVLTENHARALRGLALDNAFLDMQRLVDRAVQEDSDVVYGLYVNADYETLAFSRRGQTQATGEQPNKEAWRSLGLAKQAVIVRATTVRRAVRLGGDLLEVAVPVVGEENEVLGTIRYGLSTRRMHEAKAQASAEAKARLATSAGSVVSLVTFAALIGLFVSRMVAVRIIRPVTELTLAARELAGGSRNVRVNIDSHDELEQLGASFNLMVDDLDSSYRALEEMNRTLEQKVEQRTQELAHRNRDMRLVLDNVDQGLITVAANGTMALERSRAVDQWFGSYDGRRLFVDYVSPVSRGFGLEFQLAWEQLVEDVLPLEIAIDQMPRQLASAGRTWSFRYLPLHRDGKFEGMLLVIAEVTEQLARQREDDEQSELLQGFKRLMLDRSGFNSFLREAKQMVAAICSRRAEADPVAYRRTLHTLKGNAASMGLGVLARLCHELEEQLEVEGAVSDEALLDLDARWRTITDHIESFAGDARQRTIEVSEADYVSLVSRLSTESNSSTVLHELLTWQLEPVSRSFQRLADQARALARRLGKGDIEVEIQGNNVRLDPDAFGPLFLELVHVVRNAIDHGLEAPAEREATKKPRRGHLLFKAEAMDDTLVFEVCDDGQGIDWDAVARKAATLGLPCTTPEDLMRALCTDGVTTKSEATAISGRGVGMAAVRQRVEAMGGSLEARSVRGVGTSWLVRLPWAQPSIVDARAWRVRANGRSRSLMPPSA